LFFMKVNYSFDLLRLTYILVRLNRSDVVVHLFVIRKGEVNGIHETIWMEVIS
jgi:hypothetical protein